jgi:hypothetical protein
LATAGAAFVIFKLVATPSFDSTTAPFGEVMRKVPFLLLRSIGLGDLYAFTWPACVAVLALFAFAAWILRRGIGLGGLVWVAAGTLPIIGVEKLSSRYLYLPAAGWPIVLCGVVAWLTPRLSSVMARRAAVLAGIGGLVLVVAANAIDIQREIDDYARLAAPYEALAAGLGDPLAAVESGGSVVVVDAGPRNTIQRLAEVVSERGTMTKLIPYRRNAIGGLIELQDLMNGATPRRPGSIAQGVPLEDARDGRWILWDGSVAQTLSGPPTVTLPRERTFAARWGTGLKGGH